MGRTNVIPRKELKRIIKQFIADENRGISIEMFCDLAGIARQNFYDLFVYDKYELSEYMQIRVSKAYKSWLNGDVAIMQNRDRSKFLEYRKQPKPMLKRNYGLKVVGGEIKMDIGVRNRADYSGYTLDEQLERG